VPAEARRRRAIELLDEVGIRDPDSTIDSYPHEFSGGMRQRVMIAMALINEPRLLIADEPTTALDVTIQAQILRLIADLQKKHDIGVIFISHDLAVVADIADEIAVMQQGRIVERGDREAIFDNAQHPYTQKLLAAIPRGSKACAQAPDEALIRVRHLKTWFEAGGETVKAVDDVSFDIRRGEILGLVGESGSGKSTIGRSLLRLVPVTGGEVLFDGTDVTALRGRGPEGMRRRMQMIFQDPFASLNPRMTGLRHARRAPAAAWYRGPQERRRGGPAPDGRRGSGAQRGAQVSPRVLRRPAPAHRHRSRPGHAAGVRGRR
jgi:oligopeptide transport system ATP-binding protein